MLEVVGEEVSSELRGSPDNKGRVVFTPRDDVVSRRVVYKLVGLSKEWGRDRFM